MKKIIFKTLKVKNFLSIGKTPVVINFQKGLNIITGVNKDLMDRQNGVGKSAVLDALYFSIFGETMRELKKEFLINNVTNEGSEISLSFSVDKKEYEIIRTLKPSKCFLFENGKDITRDSISNTTSYISSILEITPEIFINCVCLSINSTIPFMAQKKLDKKKFIEGIFNLNIFSKMNSNLKEEYSNVKKEIESNRLKYYDLERTIKLLNDQNKRNKEERNNGKKTIEEKIEKYDQQISDLKEKISKYTIKDNKQNENKLKKLDIKRKTKNDEFQNTTKKQSSISTEIRILKENLSKIGTDKDECPVCLRSICDSDISHIEKRKSEINLLISNKSDEIKKLTEKISSLKKEISMIEKASNLLKDEIYENNLISQKLKNDQKSLSNLQNYLKNEKQGLLHLEKFKDKEEKNIGDLEIELKEISECLDKTKTSFDILENVKFVLSEEGVKSFVVKKILNLFNSKIAFYLKELNANAIIKFDQYFEEDIKNDRGKPTMYFNYSGAERKAIDLAVMFAFIDMLRMQTNVYYNVQFYDELLDTSLDSAGVENVVRILNEFVEKYSCGIYVISHRKECSKLANGEIVFLEKNNGITKRIADHNA